jgi:16S rRNA (guanine527-N7)-methyltransferase
MDIITKYFPKLSEQQKHQFEMLQPLYEEWNSKINVISRKDIGNLYEHHVLHSLAIAEAVRFKSGTSILDFGTGGGFPGIPLAIMFPECKFTLIDGTGKKIMVANEVIKAIGLDNVTALHRRGEEEKGKYDFIVSRAVMPLPDIVKLMKKNISSTQKNASVNGFFVLKGGEIGSEVQPFKKYAEATEISTWFKEDWFKNKYVIYLPCWK